MPTRESLLAERHRDGSLVFPPDSLLRAMLVSGTMPYGSIEALRRMHESNPTPAAPPLARAMLARYGITLDANGNAVFPPAPRLVPVRATIEEMAAHPMMLLYYTDPRRGKRQLAFAAYNATGAIDGQPPLAAGVCVTGVAQGALRGSDGAAEAASSAASPETRQYKRSKPNA